MKKKIVIIIGILILIQFIRPSKNNGDMESQTISKEVVVPSEVQKILEVSCYDCHSNKTVYPWYSEIAPISWYIAHHVNEGKEHFNISEWTSYNKYQKKNIIYSLEKTIERGKMPLKSYLIKHPEATLSEYQKELLINWIRTLKSEN